MKTNGNMKSQLPKQKPEALCALAPENRPRWRATLSRLWPWTHLHVGDLPWWAQDAIYCDHRVSLSFADRLRVLVSGRLRVRSQTLTENKPGRVETISLAHPLAPAWVEGEK